MIPRVLALLAAFECRAFLCALAASALFLGAGLLFALMGVPEGAPWCAAYGLAAFALTLLFNAHEKQNRPRR